MGLFGIVPPGNTDNLGAGFGRFEPKRAYNFRVGWQVEETSSAIAGLLSDDVKNSLALAIKSMQRPELSNEAAMIQHGNEKFKYAGRPNLANDSVAGVWYDVIPGTALTAANGLNSTGETTTSGAALLSASAIFWEWQQIISDYTTGATAMANEYKANLILDLYTPDANQIVERWIYYGIWPQSVSRSDLDMAAGDDPQEVNVGFSVDKMFRVAPSSTATVPTGAADFTSASAGGVEADKAIAP